MKTMREEKLGTATLRLVSKGGEFIGVLIAGSLIQEQIEGKDGEAVWSQLLAKAREASPDFFGYPGARARFLHYFPGGFAAQGFDEHERAYKIRARAKLEDALPLAAALDGSGMGSAALAAVQATNLLSVFEKAKLSPLLKGGHADSFIRAAAQFAMGDHEPALAAMQRIAAPYDSAKWTVATYLPFLWLPDQHMFLKPTVTRDYAARVGHSFAHEYAASLDAAIYSSLLDLADETRRSLADLEPRDNIDIQSLIWIVGEYKLGDGSEGAVDDAHPGSLVVPGAAITGDVP